MGTRVGGAGPGSMEEEEGVSRHAWLPFWAPWTRGQEGAGPSGGWGRVDAGT